MMLWSLSRRVFICCGVLLCVASANTVALADDPVGLESGDLSIATDATDYNIGSGTFNMPHHVTASRPGTRIDGDRAHGNSRTKIVILQGHVVVHQEGRSEGGGMLGLSQSAADPSTLTTDELTIEIAPKQYTAEGHVHFIQGARHVVADHALLNDTTHMLHLTGNVSIDDNGQRLSASALDYNTRTEEVHAMQNVQIVVPLATPEPHPSTGSAVVTSLPKAHHGR